MVADLEATELCYWMLCMERYR